jgi:hypothetical protein
MIWHQQHYALGMVLLDFIQGSSVKWHHSRQNDESQHNNTASHTHTHTHLHTHTHTHTPTQTHLHTHTYTDTPTQTHLHRHTYTDTPTQTHLHRHTYTDTHTTQGILKGEVSLYCCPPVWQVWNQPFDNWQCLFLFTKQTNPNQSIRRSIVQWYFPL